MTCHQALKQYLRRGRHFVSGRAHNSCPDRCKKLAPLKDTLLARDTLQQWSGLTLQQRVAKIMQDYGLQVSVQALFQFYKRHKVKFYASSTAYHAAFHKKHVEQRKQFAVQLAQLMHEKVPIVYFNESGFNSWLRPTHTWGTKAEPIKLVINERRVGSITVYGAISPFLRHFVYMLGTSTN